MNIIMLLLTCSDKAEAERISITLIKQKLIACSKMMPVHAMFHWEGAVNAGDETMLVMETRHELCADIERVVREHHSYQTFVLTGVPVAYVSQDAQKWFEETLK